MTLVSEVRAACPVPTASEEAPEKTPSATAKEVAHDARGGVDPDGQPWPAPYYLHDGLRRVTPYFHTYNTYVKGRWCERGILDVFASEFRDREREYYKDALERGDILINGQPPASPDTILHNGQLITHTQHRHEPPVTPAPVGIVHEDDAMIVIDKPAGVPVHPAGRYFHNSVTEILRAQRAAAGAPIDPLPCNRLDRLTSGIMFVAKDPRAAEALCSQLKRRTLRKEYVARVAGEFPAGSVVCDRPVLVISPKLGLNAVRASGKQAITVFRRLAYYPPADDDDAGKPAPPAAADGARPDDGMHWKRLRGHSIVRCFPLTGRTHQLRVHLQFLGHPIANDPIYANRRVFGAALGRGRDTAHADDDIVTALSRMGKSEVADAVAYHDGVVDDFQRRRAERLTGEMCAECDAPLYSDPGAHEMGMFLHARRYECASGAWAYETPGLPAWAMPPAGREGPTACGPETEPLDVDFSKLKIDEDFQEPKVKNARRENGRRAKNT